MKCIDLKSESAIDKICRDGFAWLTILSNFIPWKITILIVSLLFLSFFNHAVAGQLSGGYSHSMGLSADGTLWSWGGNAEGQLGHGTQQPRDTPFQVGSEFSDISSWWEHSLGLKFDGSLWAWGYNYIGQLGDGTQTRRLVPVQVGSGFTAIAAGQSHSLGLKSDGSLWAWGSNVRGQLGDGTQTQRLTPIQVGSGFTAIAAGKSCSFGFKSDGSLWAWGYNDNGQLGDGTAYIDRLVPVQVGTGFTAIAVGYFHSLGLKSDGTLWAWGDNYSGQLGDGTQTQRLAPVQVGAGFAAIAAGQSHSLGLKSDGTLWAWGDNHIGQLGDGTQTARSSPVLVGSDFTAIAAGQSHSLGLKSDGSLWGWGFNENGQLGDGTRTALRLVPTQVLGENGEGNLNLLYDEYSITPLQPGEQVNNITLGRGMLKFYRIDVPDNAIDFSVDTAGGDGNLALFLFREKITIDNVLAFSEGDTNEEYLKINAPTPGTYYICLFPRTNVYHTSLSAAYMVEQPASLANNKTSELNCIEGQYSQLNIKIPEKTMSLRITTSGGLGDCNIIAVPPDAGAETVESSTSHGTNKSVIIKDPSAGEWNVYIGTSTYYTGVTAAITTLALPVNALMPLLLLQ